ncbi:CD44 antigen isoform X8 [Eschrichtius robustus]|uniref:CD44 antigen isoform X8 n=1 Tax=Eschrichtius robustus TaxID=9764 RepID=UPI0035C21E25
MDTFWWRAAWGLCLVQLSLAQIDLNITCRYAGIFHVEKNGRYSISKTEAADLCKAFNCTLPTMAQMEAALRIGFETCRYGFIDGHVVIPRIHPNSVCAANNTGVYILTSNTSQYDTYCFNASAPLEEDCTSVTDLPNAFEGPITITIVNRDGTRYTKKGEYRTNPDDINPSTAPEEDMSSGSSSERSTSGGYNIFHTHLPTVYPTADQDSPWVSSNPETTPTTSRFSTTAPPRKPTTALMSTSGTTSKTATKRQEVQDWFSWWFQPSTSKIHLHTTTIMAGTDSNIISAGWEPTEENEDESDRHPSYSGSGIDDDEDFISSTKDQDLSRDPSGRSYTTQGSESAGHSSGSQERGINTTSGPMRKPQIPEWLIILASLLALALILAVCIAVNSRRRCGQKKKLVINNGNGTVEERKPSGLNGETSKSQEMVHLVNKEPSGTPDQFMTADERRNLQNVDMKIGV